jgi:Protein of unknown function (DUF1592)/Protein of unknown function (DUF1588)/Protein of unknown function (DUF1595)/Protein of unknown function (DUF1587)/Protein of unknown function (DUF1585)
MSTTMREPAQDRSSSGSGARSAAPRVLTGMDAHRTVLAARALLAVMVAASLASCKSSSAPSSPTCPTCPTSTTSPLCTATAPGPAPLRRLTRFELGRSLADVMGLDPALVADLPPDEVSDGYDNSASAYSVSALHAAKLLDLGEAAATAFLADGARVRGVAACDPTTDGGACLAAFVKALGARLWRRPLTDGETTDLVALAASAAPGDSHAGASAVIAAMLQSPGFLYRPETPRLAGAAPRLPAAALASRLAYLVTSTAPDDTLLAAADQGRLATNAGLMAETERLLGGTRAVEAFQHFVTEWWELEALPAVEKDTNLFRDWTDDLPAAFAQETRLFLADAWQKGPTLERLLTSNTTFADLNLADYYGYDLPTGSGFQPITVNPARAAGLFGQGAFLVTHAKVDQTSPVLRGKFVRARLLCNPPGPPPPDIVITPPVIDPRKSSRERFQEHTASAFCASCHQLMDPIGFTFEHFDAAGRWRDNDAGSPVDATGMLNITDVDGPVDGVQQLAAKLLGSAQVRSCVATQWFRWAFGRTEQTDDDLCTVGQLAHALDAGGGDLRSLVRATVQSPTFLLAPVGDSP